MKKKLNFLEHSTISNPNNRIVIMNIASSISIKGFAAIIGVVSFPLIINYFKNDLILGTWYTLFSILNWILMFDIGIGNGLRNHLVKAIVNKDETLAKQYISSAYFVLGIISSFILLVGLILVFWLDWNAILTISQSIVSKNTLIVSILLIFITIVLQFWLRIIHSILYAIQKTALSNLLTLISSVLFLTYLLFIDFNTNNDRFLFASIAQLISINLPLIIITFLVFSTFLKDSVPSLKFCKLEYAKPILSLGGEFFVIQIFLLIISSSNEILINSLYSPGDVVSFQIYNKLFFLIIMIFSIFTQPIWSAITKAYSERNYLWVKSAYIYVLGFAFITSVFVIVIGLFMQPIIDLWLGNNSIEILIFDLFPFVVVCIVTLFINSFTTVANGLGKIRVQTYCVFIGAILKIVLSFVMSNFTSSWSVIIYSQMIALVPLLLIQGVATSQTIMKLGKQNQMEVSNAN